VTKRGLSVLGGCSKALRVVTNKSRVALKVTNKADVDYTETFESWWDGRSQAFDVWIYPDDWENGKPPIYDISFETTSLLNRRRMPKKPDQRVKFTATLEAHDFPTPSAPIDVRVTSRTKSNVQVEWKPPVDWGGCAIHSYEAEMREKAKDGAYSDWRKVFEAEGWEVDEGIAANVYAGEVRIRAYNVACTTPGPWSDVYVLDPEEEEDAKNVAATRKANLSKARRNSKRSKARSANKVESEEGVAVVDANEEDAEATADQAFGGNALRHAALKPAKFASSDKMEGWSELAKAVGEFYVKVGVPGGVEGTLFDLTPQQVEGLVTSKGTEMRGISKDEPLVGLACVGCWVMQTLAHYSECANVFVILLNQLTGLLLYLALGSTGVGSKPEIEAILLDLIAVYETMQETNTIGYVWEQLSHKYSKAKKERLENEWYVSVELLRDSVVEHVLAITSKSPYADRLAIERAQLGPVLESAKIGYGALSGKVQTHLAQAS